MPCIEPPFSYENIINNNFIVMQIVQKINKEYDFKTIRYGEDSDGIKGSCIAQK